MRIQSLALALALSACEIKVKTESTVQEIPSSNVSNDVVETLNCNENGKWRVKNGKVGSKQFLWNGGSPYITSWANVRDSNECTFETHACSGQLIEIGKEINNHIMVRVMGNRHSDTCAQPGVYRCELTYKRTQLISEISLKLCTAVSGTQDNVGLLDSMSFHNH